MGFVPKYVRRRAARSNLRIIAMAALAGATFERGWTSVSGITVPGTDHRVVRYWTIVGDAHTMRTIMNYRKVAAAREFLQRKGLPWQ